LGPNEIETGGPVTGTVGGKTYDSASAVGVWRIEPKRMRVTEASIAGQKTIANGRIAGGGDSPWYNKCGAQ
jgi:hypothetical protein